MSTKLTTKNGDTYELRETDCLFNGTHSLPRERFFQEQDKSKCIGGDKLHIDGNCPACTEGLKRFMNAQETEQYMKLMEMGEGSLAWEAADKYIFHENDKFSNNNDEAGDNFESFLAGWKSAMKHWSKR